MENDPNAETEYEESDIDQRSIGAMRMLELTVIAAVSSVVILQLIWVLGDNGV